MLIVRVSLVVIGVEVYLERVARESCSGDLWEVDRVLGDLGKLLDLMQLGRVEHLVLERLGLTCSAFSQAKPPSLGL